MSKRLYHIAFIKFKPECSSGQIATVFRSVEELAASMAGIQRLTWGPNVSPEGLDQGFTHSFVMIFENAAARDRYLDHPAHKAALQAVGPLLESIIVCDHEA